MVDQDATQQQFNTNLSQEALDFSKSNKLGETIKDKKDHVRFI